MEIRVYDSNLRLLGIIENQTSLLWTRRYYEPGEFEITAPNTPSNRELLVVDNLVSKKNDDDAGVIEYIQMSEGAEDNTIVARGRFLSSYLDRRITKATKMYKGLIEDIINQMIFTDTIPIPRLYEGERLGITDRIEFQCTYKNLLDYVMKLCQSATIGFRLKPDFSARLMTLELYKGVNKTTSQGVVNRVVFSENYENLNSVKYTRSKQLYKTRVYIGGQGEGSERVYASAGYTGTGLELREEFFSGADLSPEGLTIAEYSNILVQRAYDKLAELQASEYFECETEPFVNYQYKVDYDLGDIVTVNKQSWGITKDLRITELMEVYENGTMTVIPTFGTPLPTSIDWEDY